jgi:hypothetical protein
VVGGGVVGSTMEIVWPLSRARSGRGPQLKPSATSVSPLRVDVSLLLEQEIEAFTCILLEHMTRLLNYDNSYRFQKIAYSE